MNNVLWHGDGCDTKMSSTGFCPRCAIAPSMQDTFFAPPDWKPTLRQGHVAGLDYKSGDRVVFTNAEMTIFGQRGTVVARGPEDADHHVRVVVDGRENESIGFHQNDVKPVDVVERIGGLNQEVK